MKKYWVFFKSELQRSFEYRGMLATWFLVELMGLVTVIFVWLAVYRDNLNVGGYDFKQMIFYYVLVPIVGVFTNVYISESLPKKIKDGVISAELIKPYNLKVKILVGNIAWRMVKLFIYMPIFVAMLAVVGYFFGISLSFGNAMIGFLVCFLVYFLHAFMDLSISYMAFWMDDVWALSHLKFIVLFMFGGMSFPLDLLPENLWKIFNFLPFKFIYFVPVSVLRGRLSSFEIGFQVVQLLAWIGFFHFLSEILFKLGLKKYEAYGN
ncbi:ABC-2 family transporter protein [Patescibacteria group bacterium]|nr:ABC-2 family transporter protein [Patescibacteria group bacterium]MCG2701705.1 ABC-2 family transporter protein [Candidatus Parcubacteria bacterium]MBU4265360.1 ABC-2 family transporter protein [Patescibacteria group bacterium]MBU4390312.1 ABC-2 family transporter protein [Patescibacteria group bacterium]MBU4396559.1 ABC-2 family transporter protein [Patescibacteria group bacterium]